MAWFDELNLPGAQIDGHFGYVTADGVDEDENPDVLLASGTVTFTATTPAARVDGAWLGIQPVTADIFEGRIVLTEDSGLPVRLLATDANIGVADWAWKATFKIDGFTLEPLTFKAPRDTTVNLTADLIPIKSQPYQIIEGASIVDAEVDGMGKMRFEMSDGTYTQWVDVPNGEQGVQGVPGEKGDPGKDGAAASLTMGTVTAGTTADAWMTGTATDKQLNLTLPRGQKGDRGEPGLAGPSGIASITSPDGGVWMIDQAGDGDADALADLQQAVYGKAEQADLDALGTRVDGKADTAALTGKADASALSALASVVDALPQIQAGKIYMEPVAANERLSLPVEFPAGFSTPPIVTVTPESGVPNVEMRASASAITETGFTMNFYRASASNTSVMWIAVAP